VGNDGVNQWDVLGQVGAGPWTSPLPPPPSPPSSPGGGWGGAFDDLINWLTGNAPTTTGYGPESPESDDMKGSPIGKQLRDGYLNKFKNKKCSEWKDYTNVKLLFGASEFIQSIPNGTAHFVGSGRGDAYTKSIDEPNCKIKSEFVVTNTTSLKSALYHLIPNSWNNTSTGTPGANWTQTYTWNEEFECTK
jgi:hypothetical protein